MGKIISSFKILYSYSSYFNFDLEDLFVYFPVDFNSLWPLIWLLSMSCMFYWLYLFCEGANLHVPPLPRPFKLWRTFPASSKSHYDAIAKLLVESFILQRGWSISRQDLSPASVHTTNTALNTPQIKEIKKHFPPLYLHFPFFDELNIAPFLYFALLYACTPCVVCYRAILPFWYSSILYCAPILASHFHLEKDKEIF